MSAYDPKRTLPTAQCSPIQFLAVTAIGARLLGGQIDRRLIEVKVPMCRLRTLIHREFRHSWAVKSGVGHNRLLLRKRSARAAAWRRNSNGPIPWTVVRY